MATCDVPFGELAVGELFHIAADVEHVLQTRSPVPAEQYRKVDDTHAAVDSVSKGGRRSKIDVDPQELVRPSKTIKRRRTIGFSSLSTL